MTRLFLPLLFISSLCTCVRAQILTDAQRLAIDSILMIDIPDGGPGAALGIVQNGKVIYEKYAGLADIESNRPIEKGTRFNLASNGKQFTALCVLKLADAGLLRLDDDFRKYLPAYFPNVDTTISIAQLLNHTSGLRDVYELWGLQGLTWWKEYLNNEKALALLQQQRDLNFPSGSQHSYSNSNYLLLAELIATVSGQSFRQYSDDLFQDLGMTDTNFAEDHKNLGENIARPYFNFDTWQTYKWRSELVGDGALFSTLGDQLLWESALMNGQAGQLSPALLASSQQAITVTTGYGYGLETQDYRGLTSRWHEGSTGAWKASFIRFPEQQLAIVAMNNSGKFGTSRLVRKVAEVLLGKQLEDKSFLTTPATVGPAVPIQQLTGVYATEGKFYAEMEDRDGKLFLIRNGRNDVELELEAGNIYRQLYDPAFKQEFIVAENGTVSMTFYYWQHAPYSFNKKDIDWSGYDCAGLDGKYFSEELQTTVTLKHLEAKNYQVVMNKKKRTALLREPDFLTVGGTYKVRIQRDAEHKIVGFLVNGDRVEKVRFERE